VSVLAVTGLAREAAIVSGPDIAAIAGGGDCIALQRKLETAIGPETGGIISIGIAGALSPRLSVGSVVAAGEVVAGAARFLADRRWLEEIALRLPDAARGAIAGADKVLASPGAKAALFDDTGALAVDMESHIAARLAASCGVPFAALRVISDRAGDTLPGAALVAMKPDGGIALGRVLGAVLAEPRQVPLLLKTARDSRTAFAALLRCRNLLGLGLACPYLG
jgi:hopanoid-associated phosphorylase